MFSILIPTYKRNSSLLKLLHFLNEACLDSSHRIIIRDNKYQNNLDLSFAANLNITYTQNLSNIGGRGSFRCLLEDFLLANENKYCIFISDDDLPLSISSLNDLFHEITKDQYNESFQVNSYSSVESCQLNCNPRRQSFHFLRHFFIPPFVLDTCTHMTGFCISRELAKRYLSISQSNPIFDEYPYPMQTIALISRSHRCLQSPSFVHVVSNKKYWNYTSHSNSFITTRMLIYKHLIENNLCSSQFNCQAVASLFLSRNLFLARNRYNLNLLAHPFYSLSFINPLLFILFSIFRVIFQFISFICLQIASLLFLAKRIVL